jgi:GDP-L-fucose synthase
MTQSSDDASLAPEFTLKGRRIWVAGHRGMVGSAIVRRLADVDCEVLTVDRQTLDLRHPDDTERWLKEARPEVAVIAAARVGGILANDSRPVDFIEDNLAIELSAIGGAFKAGVTKLLFLGSSCIYPKHAEQPIKEEDLLTGPLEPTNEWYALAKIAGVKLCQAYRKQHGSDFISCQPTNLYGPGDNFDLQTSHVLPALIRKAHDAKVSGASEMTVWGTGRPRREFLHVDDLADGCIAVLERYSGTLPINIGCGDDISIDELTQLVCRTVGFDGHVVHDTTKPDGTPRKLLDVSRLFKLGWRPRISLEKGIRDTYEWFLRGSDRAPQ